MMDNQSQDYQLFLEYFTKNFTPKLIFDTGNGYLFFHRYDLRKIDGAWTATRLTDDLRQTFCRLRYAAAWCILDRYNKIQDSRCLLEANRRLVALEAEIKVHSRLQCTQQPGQREINRDKYLVAIDKHRRFQFEIDKYIKVAKNCQDRGYQNELTRVTRK